MAVRVRAATPTVPEWRAVIAEMTAVAGEGLTLAALAQPQLETLGWDARPLAVVLRGAVAGEGLPLEVGRQWLAARAEERRECKDGCNEAALAPDRARGVPHRGCGGGGLPGGQRRPREQNLQSWLMHASLWRLAARLAFGGSP